MSGVSFVETYYVPFQEDHILTSLRSHFPSNCSRDISDPISNYISIGAVENGTIIHYDHWEDGYEPNLSFPIQPTTEIWGDGNSLNGIPPGYTIDILSAADIIVLNDTVQTTTRQSIIDFDGGDKIGSRGNLSITRLGWADGSDLFLAGALEVYPTTEWGNRFDIPVGPNTNINDLFEYTGAVVMAAEATNLQIDANGDGTFEQNVFLNEGESHLINSGLNSGGVISSDNNIQVHLITGDICHTYETRWFTLSPTSDWSNSYLNPVATPNNGGNNHIDFVNAPTYVHIYNPNLNSITVEYQDKNGIQDSEVVNSKGTSFFEIQDNTGSQFYSIGGEVFYAVATIDSDRNGNNARNDWGFALSPESSLSSQITLVGFAPGANPIITTSENSAPVWITTNYPNGSSNTNPITICIDYNGDGGALIDTYGTSHDATVVLDPLDNAKLYDPDGDQTGMQIWVCDNSDALIAGAWGQDPVNVNTEKDAVDLGVALPNGIPFATSKCVELTRDFNSNGFYDECDEIRYTVVVVNSGALPISTSTLSIIDTLPDNVTYIPNTTTSIRNGVITDLADDGSPQTIFPIDEGGIFYSGDALLPGDSLIFRFDATIDDVASSVFIRNVAEVSNVQQTLFPEVTFPVVEPTGPVLTGIPDNTTIDCDDSTSPPSIGTQIFATNNCEEMEQIDKTSWSIVSVDSEDTASGELALNAIDGNVFSVWSTQFNGGSPTHPHEIIIDLGGIFNVAGIGYHSRKTSSEGRIEDFEFYVSNDLSDWDSPVVASTWLDVDILQEETFNTKPGRFIRLVALSEVNGNPWTSIGELDVLACTVFTPVDIVFSENTTQTNDGSSTDDCYEMVRTWTATDHCGQTSVFNQSIVVQDTVLPIIQFIPSDITVNSTAIPEPPLLDCSISSNLALGKDTRQSSVRSNGASRRAVDGGTNSIYAAGTTTHTANEQEPWWEVDLGDIYGISEIDIWNRTDCCSARLSNFYILVSDIPFTSNILSDNLNDPNIISFFQGTTAGSPSTFPIDVSGRYVRVQLQGLNTLSITEFVVRQSCLSVSDNCDDNVTIVYDEIRGPGTCSYDLTRTWTATDNCGNSNEYAQIITIASPIVVTTSVESDHNGADVSCNGASDGIGEVSVEGGVAPITISWDTGDTGTNVSNLSAGTYLLTVVDGNGCSIIDSLTITEPNVILVNPGVISDFNGEDVSCFGASDGRVFANASGGVGGLSYSWSSGASGPVASNLSAGTYEVTVTDSNNCTQVGNVVVSDAPELDVDIVISLDYDGEDTSCPNAADGEVTVSSTGGTGTVLYFWSNSFNGVVNSGLSEGIYYVTATDQNGCQTIDSIELVDPQPITVSDFVLIDPATCNGFDGTIEVNAVGGHDDFQYRLELTGLWQSSNTFDDLAAGNHNFYVRNSDGTCEVGPISTALDNPTPYACPIETVLDTLIHCTADASVLLNVNPELGATSYDWILPSGIILVSGQGTPSVEIDLNNSAENFYDICVRTISDCGDSPDCCITLQTVLCVEDCSNGIDDDGDGLIDLADGDCLSCDDLFATDEDFIFKIDPLSGLVSDTINANPLSTITHTLGVDPVSQRLYFLEEGNLNPEILYINSSTGLEVNTGVSVSSNALIHSLAFSTLGLGYTISDNGDIFEITTNYTTTDIPSVSLLGNIGIGVVVDIAVDGDGTVWGVDNNNVLFKSHPDIPDLILVGPISELTNFGSNEVHSLAFRNNGNIFIGAGSNLYELDLADLEADFIGDMGFTSFDFASCAIPIFDAEIVSTKTASPNSTLEPGDIVTYEITISNNGDIVVTNLALEDNIPAGTSYVPNSTTVDGVSVPDNAGLMPFEFGEALNSAGLSSGSIASNAVIIVAFQVEVDCCHGLSQISNQGQITHDGSAVFVLTDDPTVTGTDDPTVNPVNDLDAPMILSPAVNLELECNTVTDTTDIRLWLENNGGASASVECGDVTWDNDYTSISNNCGETGSVLVTFTISNECGLSNITTATITITDNTEPLFTTTAMDTVVVCDGAGNINDLNNWLNNNGGAVVQDACTPLGDDLTWTNDYAGTGIPALASCDSDTTNVLSVLFTVEDPCANTSSTTSRFIIIDTIPPTITTEAMDTVFFCDGTDGLTELQSWLDNNGGANYTESCGGSVSWINDYTGAGIPSITCE